VDVDIVPPAATPHLLVEAMVQRAPLAGRGVLLARSDAADEILPDALARAGAQVRSVVAYRTIEGPPASLGPVRVALEDPDLGAIIVASGSAVRGLIALLDDQPYSSEAGPGRLLDRARAVPVVSIGPQTTAVARQHDLDVVAEADRPTVRRLVAATLGILGRPPIPSTVASGEER
jgi:uroporphyrinogen-III synthase